MPLGSIEDVRTAPLDVVAKMSLLSSSIGGVRYHADEDADQNMLQDLQLAAELGKTLLERNKELENIIKLHQATEEEQTQEIEYMKKQIAALREVNNTRLKVYEQLEVSVQDLERANHHLVIENTSDKKLIKSQSVTIENLEVRCEELQKKIDDLTERLRQHATSPSRNNAQQQHQQQQLQQQQSTDWETSDTQGGSEKQRAAPSSSKSSQETIEATAASDEEMTTLLTQLQDARNQRAREQKKVSELSQQLTTLLQENSALEEQLTEWRNKAQDVKSLQDEISTLEEVRRGQLCGRCLRGMDTRTHDELSIMLDQEEYDDISMAESLVSENQRDSELTVQEVTNFAKSKPKTEHKWYSSLLWRIFTYTKVPLLLFHFSEAIVYVRAHVIVPILLAPFQIPLFILRKMSLIVFKLWLFRHQKSKIL